MKGPPQGRLESLPDLMDQSGPEAAQSHPQGDDAFLLTLLVVEQFYRRWPHWGFINDTAGNSWPFKYENKGGGGLTCKKAGANLYQEVTESGRQGYVNLPENKKIPFSILERSTSFYKEVTPQF